MPAAIVYLSPISDFGDSLERMIHGGGFDGEIIWSSPDSR